MKRKATRPELIPLIAFVGVLSAVYVFDRQLMSRPGVELREREADATLQAALLADLIGNGLNQRLGALTGAEVSFATLEGSFVSRENLRLTVDSLAKHLTGVPVVSVAFPQGPIVYGTGAHLGLPGAVIGTDTAVTQAYGRALATRRPATTGVLEISGVRRFVLFQPFPADSAIPVKGVLAAELDAHALVREALADEQLSTAQNPTAYSVFAPHGVQITTPTPAFVGWPRVRRLVRVADTQWVVELAFPPVNASQYRSQRIALWVAGVSLALASAIVLHLLRRTITKQRAELRLRVAAERAATESAREAQRRAEEARELGTQIDAARRAAERLSTSLDPDDVVELFLGNVAEILEADVASLYVLSEEGDVLVGRKRVVFRNVSGITDRLLRENIRQVQAPVAILPGLAEAVATGEPFLVQSEGRADGKTVGSPVGAPVGASSLTVPLLIAGRPVGVASWEIYAGRPNFKPAVIAFAQALAAPAAAALRTAELFASVEKERMRAAGEALRFGAVLDQMADGVIVVDANGAVERCSRVAQDLLGDAILTIAVEDWPKYLEFLTTDGRPLPAADFPLVRALRGERVMRATFTLHRAGEERHIACSAGPIQTPGGGRAGAAMVLRDVTDEQQYAELLRHTNRELRHQAEVLEIVNRQLRDATKAKDQFLAVMSHELRTPLNAIMGYADLLDLEIKGALNREQLVMIARIRDTSKHLLGLINEVLDLAKIGSGHVDLAIDELDVGAVVHRAAQQMSPIVTAKRLSITVESSRDDESVNVVADETRLTQVVLNLLSNAVKFTPAGTIRVRYGRRGDRVNIRVHDTGPGIAPDQRELIFQEFYQVDGTLSRTAGGTGLGLAIARRFARLMGGDIHVESEPGAGSEFIVDLPAAPEPVARRAPAQAG